MHSRNTYFLGATPELQPLVHVTIEQNQKGDRKNEMILHAGHKFELISTEQLKKVFKHRTICAMSKEEVSGVGYRCNHCALTVRVDYARSTKLPTGCLSKSLTDP